MQTSKELIKPVKFGIFLVLLALLFGIGLGVYFGIAEDSVKAFIANGIAANPGVHDAKSAGKLWRYIQRAHFHSSGIAAFSIGLILLVMFSSLKTKLKQITSILISLGGLYPLSWFMMFYLGASMGRKAAHHHFITEAFVYIGTGGLLLGIGILSANLAFSAFEEK